MAGINKEIGNFPHNNCHFHHWNNTELVTDSQIVPERFNSFFSDTVDDFLNKNNSYTGKKTSQHNIKTCPKTMFTSPVTENEVENVINTLKGKSSAGFDENPEFLVKLCLHYITKPLTHIFKTSVKFGIFPDLMKTAKLRPLFKKADNLDIQNYRSISVLSVFSKTLEKTMYHRLLSFLKKFNILADEQNAFRDNKSTDTACHIFI